jgi:hypothetical protein
MDTRITVRALLLGCLASAFFAWRTVYGENIPPLMYYTATQIAVLPFLLLLLCVAVINPLLRIFRYIRPLTIVEVMVIFIMGTVSSGISTFGMASQLVPLVSSLFNPQVNTKQARWDIYIQPFVNEGYFLSEPGLQEKSSIFAQKERIWRQESENLRVAKLVIHSEEQVAEAAAKLATHASEAETSLPRRAAERRLQQAQDNLTRARKTWEELHLEDTPAQRLTTGQAAVDLAKTDMDERNKELQVLMETAFAKVDTFRRGLGDDLRALPGIMYEYGEGWESYKARYARLRHGGQSLAEVEAVAQALATATAPIANAPALVARLEKAAAMLEPVATIPSLSEEQQQIDSDRQDRQAESEKIALRLKELRQKRRFAQANEFDGLDKEISELTSRSSTLATEIADNKKRYEALDIPLKVAAKVAATQTDLLAFAAKLSSATSDDLPGLREELATMQVRYHAFDTSWRRYLVGDVPWGLWFKPLANWVLLILLTYLVLMTFNLLIFRQWAHNEKLIYPLAELPSILAGVGEDNSQHFGIPSVFRSSLFYAGLVISLTVMGWNHILVAKAIIPDLKEIGLTFKWDPYIAGSMFDGLLGVRDNSAKVHIFFTLIGLSFLVPSKISFSLWFFHLAAMVELLLLVAMNIGTNEGSFPFTWTLVLNFRTAQGGGALMVFALAILWKCRHYMLAWFTPSRIRDLPLSEQKELRYSSLLFMLGSLALVLTLNLGLGVNLFYAVGCYFVILIITIGLVRAVAEGGILGFQCWFSPFHLVRSLFGMNHSWTAPSFFAPMMVYYSVLFLDIKTFIAPAMANMIKIRDDLKMSRMRFHLAVAVAILAAMAVAIVAHLILGYDVGGDKMNGWFYNGFPNYIFGEIKTIAQTNPVDTAGGRAWLLTGALIMGALLYFRQHIFWLPHPIGMIMLVNPIMRTYWTSILIGWICKTLVSKYGNKETYSRMRCLFIGLIVGELIMCLFGATLNRN